MSGRSRLLRRGWYEHLSWALVDICSIQNESFVKADLNFICGQRPAPGQVTVQKLVQCYCVAAEPW